MSIKVGRKIGFIMSLAMLVGTVVGIGIFFKSHGILRANDWNGTGTFLAWLLGGILSIAAAVSFSEIGSMKTKTIHGLPAWSQKVGGQKYGYFVRFNFSFFYVGLLATVLGFFGSEMIFMMIATFSNKSMNDFPVYAHVIVGLAILSFFITTNYLSIRTGGYIQIASTILKWIPLLIVVFAGLILATTNNAPTKGGNGFGSNAFTNSKSFSFTAMLAALPGVLFAFDAFLGMPSLRNKMKDPKKMPLAIFVGMLAVTILYLLVALVAILHGSGMVSGRPFGLSEKGAPIMKNGVHLVENGVKQYTGGFGIFDQIFSPVVAEKMGKFVVVFLLISTLGVINGFSAISISIHSQALETNTYFGAKYLRKKFGDKKVLIGFLGGITLFWTLIFGIPTMILNSDSIVDGVSNFPTLFFFGVYGVTIFLYAIQRNKIKETTKINKYVFNIAAYTAVIGIAVVVAYQVFYAFSIGAFLNPSDTTHWGLFVGDSVPEVKDDEILSNFPVKGTNGKDIGIYMSKIQSSIVFFTFSFTFFAVPFINQFLKKKFENESTDIEMPIAQQ